MRTRVVQRRRRAHPVAATRSGSRSCRARRAPCTTPTTGRTTLRRSPGRRFSSPSTGPAARRWLSTKRAFSGRTGRAERRCSALSLAGCPNVTPSTPLGCPPSLACYVACIPQNIVRRLKPPNLAGCEEGLAPGLKSTELRATGTSKVVSAVRTPLPRCPTAHGVVGGVLVKLPQGGAVEAGIDEHRVVRLEHQRHDADVHEFRSVLAE